MHPYRLKIVAILLFFVTSADAASPWVAHGPEGGTLYSVDVAGSLLRIGTQDGVYQSTDVGANWTRLGDMPHGTSVYQVLTDARNGDHVFAAGAPVSYVSTDGGVHWGATGTRLSSVTFDPADSSIALGIDNKDWSLHRSIDGGATWSTLVVTNGDTMMASAVTPDLQQAHTFLAWIFDWTNYRTSGFYRSTDDGASWTPYFTGLSDHTDTILSDASDPDTLLFTENFSDGAAVWKFSKSTQTQNDVLSTGGALRLLPDPIASGNFWLSGVSFDTDTDPGLHLYRSTDHGNHWTDLGRQDDVVLALDPITNGRLYGTDAIGAGSNGFARSDDTGATWIPSNHGLPLGATTAISISADGSEILAGRPWGWGGGTALSLDGGQTWQDNDTSTIYDVSSLARVPGADATVYATSNEFGLFKSVDGGRHWDAVAQASGVEPGSTIGVDANDPNALVADTGWSDDGGVNWYNLQFSDGNYATEFAFAPGATHRVYGLAHVDYHGTKSHLYRASQHGATFAPVADTRQIFSLGVDPRDDAHLVAFANPDSGTNGTWQVYRSTDGGDHWQVQGSVTYQTGDGAEPRIVFDPCAAGTVLAQTSHSVFRSTDEGLTWKEQPLAIPGGAPNQLAAVCHAGLLTLAAATSVGAQIQIQPGDRLFSDGFETP